MEDLIITLIESNDNKMVSLNQVITELKLSREQQLILLSRLKSFKNISIMYEYNKRGQVITFFKRAI
ncbi:hypothetical protein A5816_002947 [Enterococcus sp. 3G1_DIV0629]|nr:hypothetical protein A5816_002947 [Enterococcus sp. 3G1_DIV0629]